MIETSAEKNKRIAKNTIFLYMRMLLSLFISLYTSRVVLEVLGVSDYGVYNLVGGVVAMFTFLNGSMAGATSRFLTYEIGAKTKMLKAVFSSALFIHILLATLIIILAEAIGVWFINYKLVIPKESLYAANWVFQLSVITTFVSLTQSPYQASLIAEEKMSVFAYFDLASTILRLVIVYLLIIIPGDKLIIYGILLAILSIGTMMVYRLYCIRHFHYCHISLSSLHKDTIKKMLTFSGWDLYGNMSTMARSQGVSMLVNMFFGTIANAAIGVASSVQHAVNGFATNITMAMKPQIIKSYASEDYSYMQTLMFRGAKFSFLIILIIGLPIIIETPFIVQLWLGQVPQYSIWMIRWSLAFIFFSNMSSVMVTGVHATGNIKGPSLINGTLYLSVVPITYFAYKASGSIYIPFSLNALFVFIGAICNLLYTKMYVKSLSLKSFLSQVIFKCFLVAALSAITPIILQSFLTQNWLRFILVLFSSIAGTALFSMTIAMNAGERRFVFEAFKKFGAKLRLC